MVGEILKPFTQWAASHIGLTIMGIIFFLSLFFEFSKIKLSPITALCKWIGDRITSGLRADIADLKKNTDKKLEEMKAATDERMDKIEGSIAELAAKTSMNDAECQRKLQEIEERQDQQMASRIKAHVLNFSRQIRNGERHTLEDYENLIRENQTYEELVEKNGWKNDVYKFDFEFIMADFQKRKDTGDFLK